MSTPPRRWRDTPATSLFGIDVPIVQGPFGGGLSSIGLAASVSNLGGLGSFGCQPLEPAEIVACAHALRQHTDKPFNLNLWVDDRDERLVTFDDGDYDRLVRLFRPHFDELGVPLPERPTDLGPRYADQVQAVLDAKPAVFSFVYGIPSPDVLEACRRSGIRTLGAATTVDEAVALEHAGVDAVVATGFEAGGHRVSFLRTAEESLTGTFALVPQVADRVSIPVVAAGGIADGRGLRAALALGAHAVQIGTAFLATAQSNAPQAHKDLLFSPAARRTVLTRLFSGRLARGVESELTRAFQRDEHLLAPYPLQGRFIAALRDALLQPRARQYLSAWSGQAAPLLRHRDAEVLFRALVGFMDDIAA